jgi:hypothetical protein
VGLIFGFIGSLHQQDQGETKGEDVDSDRVVVAMHTIFFALFSKSNSVFVKSNYNRGHS